MCHVCRSIYAFVLTVLLLLASTGPAAANSQQNDGMLRGDTFGGGWTADSLSNVEIGRFAGRVVSYRFRASHTGTFRAVELYLIFRTICDGCYADGDGGVIQVQIQSDDGTSYHLPSGVSLGSTIITNPMQKWNRVVQFSNTVSIQADTLYHIILTNLDSDPIHNYISIDSLYNTAGGTDSQPAANTTDLAVLVQLDSKHAMQVNTHLVPIFSIYYDDGYRQGQTYIDVLQNALLVTAGMQVSEAIVVNDNDHTFDRVSVRFNPAAACGDIRVTITDSTNRVLANGSIDLTKIVGGGYAWYTVSFGSILFSKGAGYSVALAPENGAQFYISPIQQGTQYGFQWENRYLGHCQVFSQSQWTGCLSRTDTDIPFYFR